MAFEPLSVEQLRGMLAGVPKSNRLSDAQIKSYRDQFYQLANVILDAEEEFTGKRDDLVNDLLADCAKLLDEARERLRTDANGAAVN